VYNLIARHMLARVLNFSRGTRTIKCQSELKKSQWWPPDKILELQNQRLRQLVDYAYDNVPYYRLIFDERALKPNDIKSSADLVKLPVLTKKLIRSNFDSMLAQGFPSKDIVLHSTGGSTGEPLRFYSTKNAYNNWGFAAAHRAYGWAGYRIGDKSVLFWRRLPGQPIREQIRETTEFFFKRVALFCCYDMSASNMVLWTRNCVTCKCTPMLERVTYTIIKAR